MVKRYPHTAIITIENKPVFENGKRVSVNPDEVKVQGRYDPDGKTVLKNDLGKEIIVKGSFYSKKPLAFDGKMVCIRIDSLGLNEPVLSYDIFQSHIVISI